METIEWKQAKNMLLASINWHFYFKNQENVQKACEFHDRSIEIETIDKRNKQE